MKMRSLLFIVLIGCIFPNVKAVGKTEKQNNPSAPRITLIAPGENDILQIGKAIHFDMDLEDEGLLGSYRVEIHENADGHAHTQENEKTTYPTIFDRTWDVSGVKQKHIHHHGIVIPADAKEGIYHFIIYCTNADGGQSRIIRTVHLSKGQGTQYRHH